MNNSDQISKSCEAEISDGSLCGRPFYKDGYCIFHSPNIDKKNSFFDQFFIELRNQEEKEEFINFSGFIFPDSISFANTEFNKKVDFSFCIFRGQVDFSKTKFHQEVHFNNATFEEFAKFGSSARLKDDNKVDSVIFYKKADFCKATFKKTLWLSNVEFFEETSFYGCDFHDLVFIKKCKFHERIFFIYTTFYDVAKFDESIFYNQVSFSNAIFKKRATFKKTLFKGKERSIDFSFAYFSDVFFLFEDLKKFKPNILLKSKIKNFRFALGERSAQRFPILNRITKDAWFLNDYKNNHPIIYYFWNVTSKCGQSLLRWALWSLAIVMFFSVKFYSIYLNYPGSFKISVETLKTPTIWTFIYYSVVTFTTLGFGDIVPAKEWTQRWIIGEVIIGYIMLGGLISIFSNKLARRS